MWSWFEFSRSEGFPTQYGSQHTPVVIDAVITGLIICISIISISLLSTLPAYGKKKRRPLLIRIVISIFIGSSLLLGNYGHNWETAKLAISTPYKPSTHEEITGSIGLHISLRGINITLIGRPFQHQKKKKYEYSELEHERINYNEHFSWEWAQGRFGFGYYAGQISKDFRRASERGVPIPILQVAEYFTFDGEGIRFGRYYRLAGWYSHLLMWAAFATWIISNILSCMIVSSTAYFLTSTGILQFIAIGVWTLLRNPIEIQIPFQSSDGHGDLLLKTNFGFDYYLVLLNGIFCIILGFTVLVLDSWWPDEMCQFFGIDPLTIYDELLLSKVELEHEREKNENRDELNMMEMGRISVNPGIVEPSSETSKKVSFYGPSDEEIQDNENINVVLKRRTNAGNALFRMSTRMRKPKPPPRFTKPGETKPLLRKDPGISGNETSDNERDTSFNWPPPPRSSVLNAPPTPPPKKRYS